MKKTSGVVTMADVARSAGVSTMTVSNVINGRPRVGAATRERVLASITELGYQVNLAARHLRAGRRPRACSRPVPGGSRCSVATPTGPRTCRLCVPRVTRSRTPRPAYRWIRS